MTLDYKILWVDDQPNNISEQWENIKEHLRCEGIRASKESIKTPIELENRLKSKSLEFDLVLVDHDLGLTSSSGANLAKTIRRKLNYIDIVYYSAAPQKQLRSIINDAGIDGVYCCVRKDLVGDVKEIIGVHLRRYTSESNMRGAVVGKVSDFDASIRESLIYCYEMVSDESKRKIASLVCEKIISSAKSNLSEAEGAEALDFEKIIHSRVCGTVILYESLLHITSESEISSLKACSDILKNYLEEIIQKRNTLAHGTFDSKNKGVVSGGSRLVELNQETFRHIRNDMLRHELNLNAIKLMMSRVDPNVELLTNLNEFLEK